MPSCGVCPSVCLSVCPSVHPSVTFMHSVETNKQIFKKFSPSGSQTIIVFFCTKRDGNISTRIPITGSSNAVRVGTNRDRRRYGWLSIDDVLDLRATSATIHQSTVYRTDGDASVKYSLQQARPRRREQNRIYLYAAVNLKRNLRST